jgi:hypothetical protein
MLLNIHIDASEAISRARSNLARDVEIASAARLDINERLRNDRKSLAMTISAHLLVNDVIFYFSG